MKLLVTGCAGFIGSHLTDALLAAGHAVVGVDNFDPYYDVTIKQQNLANARKQSQFSLVEIDLSQASSYDQLPTDFDCVIHLAAKAGVRPSIQTPALYIQNNILATQLLLLWMKKNELKKMIFASSSSVYGNSKVSPFHEELKVDDPISPYAFTKRSCEIMNYTHHHLYQLDVVNLRFFTVYGPRQRPDLAIRKFVESIKNNKPVSIYGDGSSTRDYTYFEDIVHGIIAALHYVCTHTGIYENINLGSNAPISVLDLVVLLYEILGKQPQINFEDKMPGDVDATFADVTKAKRILGYSPSYNIRQGLHNFVLWYEQRT